MCHTPKQEIKLTVGGCFSFFIVVVVIIIMVLDLGWNSGPCEYHVSALPLNYTLNPYQYLRKNLSL